MLRATILVSYVICASIPAGADEIKILDVVDKFPICEIPSSLGQKCKYEFKDSKPKSFFEVCCSESREVSAFKNTATVVEPQNWFYRFEILGTVGDYALISFEDKALNGGSYHALSNYLLKHTEDGLTLIAGD